MNSGLVEAVKRHALENYDRGGWDYVIETYTDAEIWDVIAGARTEAGAIRKMKSVVRMFDERRSEVQSFEF